MDRLRDIVGRETAAVIMSVVFAQGMFAGFVHFDVASHFYCAEHQQVSHDGSHALGAGKTDGLRTVDRRTLEWHDAPSPQRDGDGNSHGCEWLTWIHETSQFTPAAQPSILVVSPPPREQSRDVSREVRRSAPAIPLEHVSPINSPPRG